MHSARRWLKHLVERMLDVEIYSTRPHGRDDCRDIQATNAAIRTILDVGANDGGSALKFLGAFPSAKIHCFEPVSGTFSKLMNNLSHLDRVSCHQLAAGRTAGTASIYLTQHSTTSSMVRPDTVVGAETVRVTTIDDFARDRALSHVDLLKIDTEGFEMEVLEGASRMLAEGHVSFVLAEVGFHPGDARHVLFDLVRDFLVRQHFALLGIYDQQLEWSGENRLRYANVCFCHESIVHTQRETNG